MTSVFGYVRVSTAKQGKGVSLTEQREAIEKHADRHGLTVTAWFEEKETAAKQGRPVFHEMLKQLRKGDAAGIIVHKIDRSSRNRHDWAVVGDLIDEGKIHFANEGLDLSTRGGVLVADIQAAVAADYIRNLSEETKKGHRGRLKQGIYPFPAPIGYRNAGPGKPKEIDPVQGPLVQSAFKRYGTGEYSLAVLAELLYDEGLRTTGGKRVFKSKLATMLRNPFYVGILAVKGQPERYKGAHEPLVSKKLFDAVGELLDRKSVQGASKHQYLFRKLFTCGLCGRFMVAERQKGHVYYRCHNQACSTKTIREEILAHRVEALLESIHLSRRRVASLARELDKRLHDACASSERLQADLRRKLGVVNARTERLTDGYLDGDIDSDLYRRTKGTLSQERIHLEQQLDRPDEQISAARASIQEILELARSPQQSYECGTDAEKREMLRIVSSNRAVTPGHVVVEPSKPFRIIQDAQRVLNGLNDQDTSRTGQLRSIMDRLWIFARQRASRSTR